MPRATVLDTSVIIKRYRQKEVLADKAHTLRDSYLSGHILVSIPSLVIYELANVLSYTNELKTEEIREALISFFNMEFDLIMMSKELIDRAILIARKYDITVYDSSFIALAESFNAFFITADKKLLENLVNFPFVCFLDQIYELLWFIFVIRFIMNVFYHSSKTLFIIFTINDQSFF